MFVLKNGCICCTGDKAGNELERTLDYLLTLSKSNAIDFVMVECSGGLQGTRARSRTQGLVPYLKGLVQQAAGA